MSGTPPRDTAQTRFSEATAVPPHSTDRTHGAVRNPAEVEPGRRARFCLAFSSPFLFRLFEKRTRCARTAKKRARPDRTRNPRSPAVRPPRPTHFRMQHPKVPESNRRSAPAVSPTFRTGAPVGRASATDTTGGPPRRNDTTFSIPTTRNVHSEKTADPPLSAPPKSSNTLAFRCGTVSAASRALPERKRSRRCTPDRHPFPGNGAKRHASLFGKSIGEENAVSHFLPRFHICNPVGCLCTSDSRPRKDVRSGPSRSPKKSRKADDQSTSISKMPTAASWCGVKCKRNASAETFCAGCTTLNRSAATSNRSVT